NLGFFPKGTILAFSKDAWDAKDSAFKAIWKVCDGTNNTPNLVGRFLRGAEYPAGSTGGADSQSVTLETKHMPKHSHTFTGDNKTGYLPIHWNAEGETGGVTALNSGVFSKSSRKEQVNGWSAWGNLNGIDFSMTPSGSISETGGSAATLSGKGEAFTFATAPSYYAVIYIMKIA
ncbi:hypothetical protein NO1_0806, partial [Candidatus Termititenax aidoneus]